MTEAFGDAEQLLDEFRVHWQSATANSNLTLHGFRRFKTMHLLNLRFLENEISQLGHQIYQAGLNLNINISLNDRLGLKHIKSRHHRIDSLKSSRRSCNVSNGGNDSLTSFKFIRRVRPCFVVILKAIRNARRERQLGRHQTNLYTRAI